ncbi:hypothetical protein SEUCBS139899_007564 [Sporothrix eucalyptigena]
MADDIATHPPTSWFRVEYDVPARFAGTDEAIAWENKILVREVIDRLQDLITQKIQTSDEEAGRYPRGRARFAGVNDGGNFNMILKFKFSIQGRPEVALRYPVPGFTAAALVSEMVENEANWLTFMEEKKVLKVPHLYCWNSKGLQGDDDIGRIVGPYILMEFVEGEGLLDWLSKWTKEADDGNLESGLKRDTVYEQVAEMYLQLYNVRFDRIGSITKNAETGEWAVTRRPMTQDMHQQALGVPGYPIDSFPPGPLNKSHEFKELLVNIHANQLQHLRNINIPCEIGEREIFEQEVGKIDMNRAMETARFRWLARRAFAKSTAKLPYIDDDADTKDGFIVFNFDFHPRNMLVDPTTGAITAVLDLEGTNTMPAAFAKDPPLWLAYWALENVLDCGVFSLRVPQYGALLTRFLDIMERIESKQEKKNDPPLSTIMRESWESKACLVNFAAQRSDCFDGLYWLLPDRFPRLGDEQSPEVEKEIEEYQEWTKKQIAAYEEERASKKDQE